MHTPIPEITFPSKPLIAWNFADVPIIRFMRALCDVNLAVCCLWAQVRMGETERTGRNNSGQQASLALAFCRHVFYVLPDRMVRCARDCSLSSCKFLRATTGRTGQNDSCQQQAALSLAFCMHVLSVSPDRMVRCAIGLSLC